MQLSMFQAVARVFWSSCSANLRVISISKSNEILEKLCKKHDTQWHQSPDYVVVWNEARSRVINQLVMKVRKYSEAYLNSEAGLQFKERVAICRKRKNALPELKEETLCSFEGKQGLK
jgi:hypothetical protein